MVLIKNGWKIYFYSEFRTVYEELVQTVEIIRENSPETLGQSKKAKFLKRINEIIYEEIPANPGDSKYRQGNTLGPSNRHWYRAKFLERFRLFYRYSNTAKIIVYAWINDENTQRKSGSKNDPYAIFANMLKRGRPPSNWDDLLRESTPS